MSTYAPQRINIFDALHTAITSKDNRKLRFVKCPRCGRHTPYRIKNLSEKTLRCKQCSAHISLYYHE